MTQRAKLDYLILHSSINMAVFKFEYFPSLLSVEHVTHITIVFSSFETVKKHGQQL